MCTITNECLPCNVPNSCMCTCLLYKYSVRTTSFKDQYVLISFISLSGDKVDAPYHENI